MLIIDIQEKRAIDKIIKKLGLDSTYQNLPVGDYLYEDKGIIVERKSIVDYINSLRSGHLYKQLMQMGQFPHPYLLISGDLKGAYFAGVKHFTIDQWLGSLARLCSSFPNIRVLQFSNDTQLIKFLPKLYSKTDDGKEIQIKDTELLKNSMTIDDIRLKLLCCFDGIGVKKADKLLKNPDILEKVDILVRAIYK